MHDSSPRDVVMIRGRICIRGESCGKWQEYLARMVYIRIGIVLGS